MKFVCRRSELGNATQFEVVDTVNSLSVLPGDVLDAAAVGKLVKNKNIDVVIVKDRAA
jgi:hypothetical protein